MRLSANEGGPPACWGRCQVCEECTACAWQLPCRVTTFATKGLTLSEVAAQSPKSVAKGVDPEDLLDFAVRLASEAGVRFRQRQKNDLIFVNAMSRVVASCKVSRVDPREYVRAQIDTAGYAAKMRGYGLQPGSFFGPNADKRYRDWLARNKRREQLPTESQVDRNTALRAQSAFVIAYFAEGDMEAAIEKARDVLPGWHPDMMGSAERVQALSHGLASYDASLPDRVIPPAEWTWPEARDFLLRVADFDEDVAPIQLSEDLGDFV